MKNGVKIAGLVMTLLICSFMVKAQSPTSTSWTVSKGVQLVSNKKTLEKERIQNSHMNVAAVTPVWMIAKGASTINSQEVAVNAGNVASKGVPSWVISKGVKRVEESKSSGSNSMVGPYELNASKD